MGVPSLPLLIPRPRVVAFTGQWVEPVEGLAERVEAALGAEPGGVGSLGAGVEIDPSRGHPEAYALAIGPDGSIAISAGSEAGVRWALHTLRQLVRAGDGRLPVGRVEDEPAFAVRGVMLDVSRNKVPTMDQLRSVVDLIASLKFNHLQLYTEHTFAYAGHEEVWAEASPITPDEARKLDAYARARGVELAANQNCFGHLATWLRRPRYQHLAEIEGDNAWRFMHFERRGPFSLCPTKPESEAFVRGLLDQLLPCFTSPLVNIGCDETFDVGWGRSRAEVERRAAAEFGGDLAKARAALFFEFVGKVCAIVRGHGKRPMLWADIAMTHPDMLDRLPGDAVGLAWGYEPDAKFAEECARLSGRGLEAWVCPGTSSWRSITGRTTECRGNLLAAAECAGRARGLMVCDWGDVGHMQQWPVTMARLADAAEAAWNGARAAFDPAAASLHVFGDRTLAIGPWLDALGDLDLELRRRSKVRNAAAIFNDLFPPVPPGPGRRALGDAPADVWAGIRDRLDELECRRPVLADGLMNEELAHTLAMTRLMVEHGLSCRLSGDGLNPREQDRAHLRELAEGCLGGLERLWRRRNRPGGMRESMGHLRGVVAGPGE